MDKLQAHSNQQPTKWGLTHTSIHLPTYPFNQSAFLSIPYSLIGSLPIPISDAYLLPRTVGSPLIKVLLFIPMAIDWMVDRPGVSDGSGGFSGVWEFEGMSPHYRSIAYGLSIGYQLA